MTRWPVFSLATSERWTDKQTQEKRERTEWHRVVVFGKTAEIAQQYLTKGSKVYIEGAIKTRKWTDDKGVERYTTEIVLSPFRGLLVLLDKKSAGRPPPVNTIDDYGTTRTGQVSTANSAADYVPEFDDEPLSPYPTYEPTEKEHRHMNHPTHNHDHNRERVIARYAGDPVTGRRGPITRREALEIREALAGSLGDDQPWVGDDRALVDAIGGLCVRIMGVSGLRKIMYVG